MNQPILLIYFYNRCMVKAYRRCSNFKEEHNEKISRINFVARNNLCFQFSWTFIVQFLSNDAEALNA